VLHLSYLPENEVTDYRHYLDLLADRLGPALVFSDGTAVYAASPEAFAALEAAAAELSPDDLLGSAEQAFAERDPFTKTYPGVPGKGGLWWPSARWVDPQEPVR